MFKGGVCELLDPVLLVLYQSLHHHLPVGRPCKHEDQTHESQVVLDVGTDRFIEL